MTDSRGGGVIVLHDDGLYRVEFHRGSAAPKGLVFTFTPVGFPKLDAPGFGVEFLLSEGFDVVAFKSAKNHWFQGLPSEVIEKAAAIGDRYGFVSTYGSSMGGFAAIAFADDLKADLCVAFSPQYSIREEFDTRWEVYARQVARWNYEIQPGSCSSTTVVILYDNGALRDKWQVERILETIDPKELHQVEVPFGGHSVPGFLKETRQLSSVARRIFSGQYRVEIVQEWSWLRNSVYFNSYIGRRAAERGRHVLAAMAFSKAISLDEQPTRFMGELIAALDKAGRTDEALKRAREAVALDPEDALFQHQLSVLLWRGGRLDEAIDHAERAVALAPDKAGSWQHLSVLLGRSGKFERALECSERAVAIAPEAPAFRRRLDNLRKRV